MKQFNYNFNSKVKNILRKFVLVILAFILVSFTTLNAQSYEILFDTYNASGWFGGDDRPGNGPRHVGYSQSVLIDSAITLNSFAFDFMGRFDYYQNPTGFGHEVTLTLNIRNDSGVILQTEQVVVPASYEGGWITWSNISMNVAANTTLIFSAYLVGAYDLNQYTSSNKCDANAGYLEGERYAKVGISDPDMELWPGWYNHTWDSNFWLKGTLLIIPVELTFFNANVTESNVILEWTTATEINNMGFEVQRNIKDNWETLDFIQGKGNSTEITQYTYKDDFIDVNYSGEVSYRLKQKDFDGTFTYSDVVIVEVDFSPLVYSLLQNFPNPFNPSTKISWQSPESSWQSVKVYDVLGNLVATLVDEYKPAGSYEVEFSAKGGSASGGNASTFNGSLTSGVYFYRIQAGSFVDTKKMILLK